MALKVPRLSEEAGRLFLRKVAAWQRLDHENIVRLLDANVVSALYLEIEYVPGMLVGSRRVRTIEEYSKSVSENFFLGVALGVADALEHVHSMGIYHLDLKPSNTLLTERRTPKVTDWGLSKLKAGKFSSVKGFTPHYAAPEQVDPSFREPDARTDVCQLGCRDVRDVGEEAVLRGQDARWAASGDHG